MRDRSVTDPAGPLDGSPAAPADPGDPGNRLLALLRRREDKMAELLAELAALESPSHDAAAQEPVLARLAAELAAAGCVVRRLRGRASGGLLVARLGGGGRGAARRRRVEG